jgi:hypothetical protein
MTDLWTYNGVSESVEVAAALTVMPVREDRGQTSATIQNPLFLSPFEKPRRRFTQGDSF